jgi:hypothetical protein
MYNATRRNFCFPLLSVEKRGGEKPPPNNYENKHLLYLCYTNGKFLLYCAVEKKNEKKFRSCFFFHKKEGQLYVIPPHNYYAKKNKFYPINAKKNLYCTVGKKKGGQLSTIPHSKYYLIL